MKENSKHISKINIIRMLKYAAAALSAVSFVTTLNGITGIVTDNVWIAGLISFGIQAIILVMGLWSIPALKTIWNQKFHAWIRIIVIFFMISLYICSIGFSSYFSFVYMSVAAYDDVQSIDYNMELELFLIDNTRTLKNYNDIIYDVLLQNIRNTAPRFRVQMEGYHETAIDEIQQIVEDIPKYEINVIPTEVRFTAEGAITAYEGVNRTEADERLLEDCRNLEESINLYITFYESQYYPTYLRYYNELMEQTDIIQAEARKKDIDNEINGIKTQIELLKNQSHIIGSVRTHIESKCNGIISYYEFLINALNDLKNGYDEILKHPTVLQGEGLTLQNFYAAVYSADILTDAELGKAKDNLQQIASTYIQSSNTIDDEIVSSIANCIEWLEKLNQCKELRNRIDQFEKDNLAQTYIISSENPANKGTNNSINNFTTTGVVKVEMSTWNSARHEDVTAFISLVKSLPNINQVLQQDIRKDDPKIKYLQEMEKKNYVPITLKETYEYSRAKLENISDMERASNYLHSENNYLAIRCLCIALFLDIASFLVGLYMYTCQDTACNVPNDGSLRDEYSICVQTDTQSPDESHSKAVEENVDRTLAEDKDVQEFKRIEPDLPKKH